MNSFDEANSQIMLRLYLSQQYFDEGRNARQENKRVPPMIAVNRFIPATLGPNRHSFS